MKKFFFYICILFFIYFLAAAYNNADWDLWARLAVGKIFFATRTVLKHDIFSYTETNPLWIDHEWLSGVIFYFLADKFGDIGLSGLKIFLMFSIFLCVFKTNRLKFPDQNPYRPIFYMFFLFSIVGGFLTTIQSHCFTFAFFALWIYLLELVKNGDDRLIWIFPATMIIWANLHGGFPAGLGVLLLFAIGEFFSKRPFKKYLLAFGISCLTTLINPYGWKYLPYMFNAITMKRPFLTEWMPLDLFGNFKTAYGFKIFAIITGFSLIYSFLKNKKEISHSESFILLATFFVSLEHIVNNTLFTIAAASYITGNFYLIFNDLGSKFKKQLEIPTKIATFVIYFLILIFGVAIIHFAPLKIKANNTTFPVKAVKFIQDNKLGGNLLVLYNWGSYALWRLYPQNLVAIDGRYDGVYPEKVISEVARFHYDGSNWGDLLNNHHTDIMLINKDYQVYNNLIQMENWKIVYQDKISAVFVPTTMNKDWKFPDKNYFEDKEKFKTRILE